MMKRRITKVKLYFKKGLHLSVNYEIHVNGLSEYTSVPTLKEFFKSSYFTGEMDSF